MRRASSSERDLDDDAEAYIVGWARGVDAQGPYRIVLQPGKRTAQGPTP